MASTCELLHMLYSTMYDYTRRNLCANHLRATSVPPLPEGEGCHVRAIYSWDQKNKLRETRHWGVCLLPLTRTNPTHARTLTHPQGAPLTHTNPFAHPQGCTHSLPRSVHQSPQANTQQIPTHLHMHRSETLTCNARPPLHAPRAHPHLQTCVGTHIHRYSHEKMRVLLVITLRIMIPKLSYSKLVYTSECGHASTWESLIILSLCPRTCILRSASTPASGVRTRGDLYASGIRIFEGLYAFIDRYGVAGSGRFPCVATRLSISSSEHLISLGPYIQWMLLYI